MKEMMLTKRQITEVLNVAVDVIKGDLKTSVQNAKLETDKNVGSGVERNYVIPGNEINEDNTQDGDEGNQKQFKVHYSQFLKDGNNNTLSDWKKAKEIASKIAPIIGTELGGWFVFEGKHFDVISDFCDRKEKFTVREIKNARSKTFEKNNKIYTKKQLLEIFKK